MGHNGVHQDRRQCKSASLEHWPDSNTLEGDVWNIGTKIKTSLAEDFAGVKQQLSNYVIKLH